MSSALQRLQSLRAGRKALGPPAYLGIVPGDLPEDWKMEYEERAAIREYDGGQVREYAESEALREIVERMLAVGQTPTRNSHLT